MVEQDDLEVRRTRLTPGRVESLALEERGRTLSYADVLARWRDDPGFALRFGEALLASSFDALFWETPPVDRARVERPFQCVVIDAPTLVSVTPEPEVFRERFVAAAGNEVVTFSSLGGDARLIAPLPTGPPYAYAHLAAFLRHAPESQRAALWREVGERVGRHLDARPMWVSTSGLGVYWLHVRLDSRPKYYQHAPYRSADA